MFNDFFWVNFYTKWAKNPNKNIALPSHFIHKESYLFINRSTHWLLDWYVDNDSEVQDSHLVKILCEVYKKMKKSYSQALEPLRLFLTCNLVVAFKKILIPNSHFCFIKQPLLENSNPPENHIELLTVDIYGEYLNITKHIHRQFNSIDLTW